MDDEVNVKFADLLKIQMNFFFQSSDEKQIFFFGTLRKVRKKV